MMMIINILGAFRKDNLDSGFIYDLIIIDMIYKSHVQDKMAALVIQVLISGDIIANVIVCLPTTKQRKPIQRKEKMTHNGLVE